MVTAAVSAICMVFFVEISHNLRLLETQRIPNRLNIGDEINTLALERRRYLL